MKKADIIRMAKEAGFWAVDIRYNDDGGLERFANLVAAAEREACAQTASDFLTQGRSPLGQSVAKAIRARGTT